MKNYFYCLLLLCCFSCKNIALHTKTKIVDTDGRKKITVNQPDFSLMYAGDYWFHSLDSRFMYVGNNFIDFIKTPISKQKPIDRKSTRLNSSHPSISRMPSSA